MVLFTDSTSMIPVTHMCNLSHKASCQRPNLLLETHLSYVPECVCLLCKAEISVPPACTVN